MHTHERSLPGGRRASDREKPLLRELEKRLRLFIAYFEDHPKERFAHQTRRLVDESRPLVKQLDELRDRTRGPAENPLSESAEPADTLNRS